MWALATGSNIIPFSLPTPYVGETSFEYTAQNAAGETDTAIVKLVIREFTDKSKDKPALADETGGFAQSDSYSIMERRRFSMKVANNDEGSKEKPYIITHINDTPIAPDSGVQIKGGEVYMLPKGSLQFRSYTGWTMIRFIFHPLKQFGKPLKHSIMMAIKVLGFGSIYSVSLYRVIFRHVFRRTFRDSFRLCNGFIIMAQKLV